MRRRRTFGTKVIAGIGVLAVGLATAPAAASSPGAERYAVSTDRADSTDRAEPVVHLVADIWPGEDGSGPEHITAFGDRVIFAATTGAAGSEVWVSDGTIDGTTMVTDLRPGASGSGARDFTELGDRIVFRAEANANDPQLWITDGTEAGTTPLTSFDSEQLQVTELVSVDDSVVFSTASGLWVSDGGTEATMLTTFASGFRAMGLTRLGDDVLFQLGDTINGAELWVTDGTVDGTHLLRDIAPGTDGSFPRDLTDAGDYAIFNATDPHTGFGQLWFTDGTEGGTRLLADLRAQLFPGGTAVIDHKVVFAAAEPADTLDFEPWITDGTTAGTTQIIDLTTFGASNPNAFGTAGGQAIFAVDFVASRLLLSTDGTEVGTHQIGPVTPVPAQRYLTVPVVSVGDHAIFRGTDDNTGEEPWLTDGTFAGTVRLTVRPGRLSSEPYGFAAVGTTAFFAATDGIHGHELWAAELPDETIDHCPGHTPTHTGTVGPDIIRGTDGDDVIVTYGGDDVIRGAGGDDLICSGAGNDRVYAGSGNNTVFGGSGIDKIRAGSGSDLIFGGDDRDFLKGGHGDDILFGQAGPDRIRGSAGNDVLRGGAHDDVLWGGPGDDILFGGSHNDILKGSAGDDRCVGGVGIDVATPDCSVILGVP